MKKKLIILGIVLAVLVMAYFAWKWAQKKSEEKKEAEEEKESTATMEQIIDLAKDPEELEASAEVVELAEEVGK